MDEASEDKPKIHRFYFSFKLNGELHTGWFEGITIRYAKDQLLFQYPECTDVMDWTYERTEDLKQYLKKQKVKSLLGKLKLHEQQI
ncbi:MAG: hypothetical protein ACR2MX_07380 [Cyclobacteriaceae bacterium]